MTPGHSGLFSRDEHESRVARVRERMVSAGLDACLVSAPENVYYLTGLDHQGYFAFEMLVVPARGDLVLITRAMESATVRDQVPWVEHVGYSDGVQPLPPPADRQEDLVLANHEGSEPAGLRPWEMSAGVAVQGPLVDRSPVAARATLEAIHDLGLARARLGIEKRSSFLPLGIAEQIVAGLPEARWHDASGLVDDCRLVQRPAEIACTKRAAAISDSMMLSAVAAAGGGQLERDVMAAVYDAMFRRGGSYPGFVPLVRTTRTLEHEHGTWGNGRLRNRDMLFLEMAGCVGRYHAPIGRLVFIGQAPKRAERIQRVCDEALLSAASAIAPGAVAGDVYEAWQVVVDKAGLEGYRRHHCGYAVGIGFPPSWSGNGTPRGLRSDSDLRLEAGMVFHLMSWLLRTGRGDSFLSDTILVTDEGCELLTNAPRTLTIR